MDDHELRSDTPIASQQCSTDVDVVEEPYTPHAFALSDVVNEDDTSVEPWPQDLAGVDINIAVDGTYIETSSGPAARELKRRYDQRFGVSVSVRSPYAITAFVNQHGKQMFRVGHRELSAPAASAPEIAAEVDSPPRSKRPSRMSVHALFPVKASSNPKKLRKTRSIPSIHANEHGELTHHTGRAHSQSVTAIDIPRYARPLPSRHVDVFGELMDWDGSTSSPSSVSSPNGVVFQPFGPGVSFESPMKKPNHPPDFLPPPPRHLRLMQSFESGMTARQEPMEYDTTPTHSSRLPDRRYSFRADSAARPSSTYEPPEEVSILTMFAATVFDVLQTYRGLPELDKLGFEAEGKTVKISLSEDQSAAPRDDPRFVIWGETLSDHDQNAPTPSRNSSEISMSRPVSLSIRRSSRVSRPRTAESSSSRRSSTIAEIASTPKQRVLIAATIERWIAQLTSDLNYDELLDFFLTYRTFVTAVELGHLLIARFSWALQQPKNAQDAKVRQVVRVRTFVAIRYWLLTFFTVDFVPNRELRLVVSKWLNTIIHDPLLQQHSDGLGIVRRLAKVAKDCKQAHLRATGATVVEKPKSPPKQEKVKDHVLGQKFAEAVLKDEDESDVDLDYIPEECDSDSRTLNLNTQDPANAHLAAAHPGAVMALSPTLPLSSINILQRIDQRPGLATEGGAYVPLPAALTTNQGALSRAFVKTIGRLGRLKRVLHSRSNTRTTLHPCTTGSEFDMDLSNGNLGQYFQAAQHHTPAPLHLVADSHFVPPSMPSAPTILQSVPSEPLLGDSIPGPRETLPPVLPEPVPAPDLQHPMTPNTPTQPSLPPRIDLPDLSIAKFDDVFQSQDSSPSDDAASLPTPPPEHFNADRFSLASSLASSFQQSDFHTGRPASIRSYASSTGSFGEILDGHGSVKPTFGGVEGQWGFDVVSIDDLDMSDTSSDFRLQEPTFPPGLLKQARKLPQRKDFEFLPRRSEVSSMGIVSTRDSVTSGPSSSGTRQSTASSGMGYTGPVQQWQLNALLDSLSNDEEDGDVADALRRLEGQINPEKMEEKKSKVDGWLKEIRTRIAAGDYSTDEAPRFPVDSDEEDDDELHSEVSGSIGVINPAGDAAMGSVESNSNSPLPPGLDGLEDRSQGLDAERGDTLHTPVPKTTLAVPSGSSASSDTGSVTRSEDAKPAVEDAVPLEIIQSRMPPEGQPGLGIVAPQPFSSFGPNGVQRVHRSFILEYRAQALAEQFAMIDRDLFMDVRFEELVTEEWMVTTDVNVYDWSSYVKDRARWKADNTNSDKTTALAAVRARFNLIANFVMSEVLLTPQTQRPPVVAKFIRIAWKSYQLSNFNTLVAIITALQGKSVDKAMNKSAWNRVGSFEIHVFRNLKTFVGSGDGFSHIRRAVESIVDAKPLDSSSHTPSITSGGTVGDAQQGRSRSNTETKAPVPMACVPFIGVYLAQLSRLKKLPDLIDPTSPNEIVEVNPDTGDVNPPAHPEVFAALAPLPPDMWVEPLVNVHKQRQIAAVIKSLVAGQHLASRVNFDVDKRLSQRCWRLRAMDPETLQRVTSISVD